MRGHEIEFAAAAAAVRAAEPEATEGYALHACYAGIIGGFCVTAGAGGIERRWLVTTTEFTRGGVLTGVGHTVHPATVVVTH